MTREALRVTATALMADDKGLLAMDESTSTCDRRFAAVGIPQTEDRRRAYRDLLITTPGLGDWISGAILCDETFHQSSADGTPFPALLVRAGVIPGIKVDIGAKALAGHAGETVTEGLDGLRDRLAGYAKMGACFAKWRAVFSPEPGCPSPASIAANAHALARYGALCQEAGLVPIIEAEVLMDGDHDLATCLAATRAALHGVFEDLFIQGVALEGMILKPNMVLPGLACAVQDSAEAVADATLGCLLESVPAVVPGIAFLSEGQSSILASVRLNAISRAAVANGHTPWPLTFSFSRAVQRSALETWRGDDSRRHAAQVALIHRLRCNQAARRGAYVEAMETA